MILLVTLIVEGFSDVSQIEGALGRDLVSFIVTDGSKYNSRIESEIEEAIGRGDDVYVMSDPDEMGDFVFNTIRKYYPLERIEVDPNRAKCLQRRGYKYGVEYCSYSYIRELLSKYLEKLREMSIS
jgi:5S rRNA maturation endonuclease (ribonuclease M5)